MKFSSLLFLFQFLPAVLILYYITPKKAKNAVLVLCSLAFYAFGEFRYLPLLLFIFLINYFAGLLMSVFDSRPPLRALMFGIALTLSLGSFFAFHYINPLLFPSTFLQPNAITGVSRILPLSLGFYTLQALGYTVDVFRRSAPSERNPIDVALFILLFPKLIAGPFVTYAEFAPQLKERSITAAGLDDGMEDLVLGLARKVLIADSIGTLWLEAETIGFGALSTGMAWLSLLAFMLQIYFEFSGYSQMAVGLGKMLGFQLPKNFDSPYAARSVTEFWRRYHMSFGTWLKSYIYVPLGGSRRGQGRASLNLLVVWLFVGLWLGFSFNHLVWVLYMVVLLVIERMGLHGFLAKHRILSHCYMLLAIILGWTLFATSSLPDASVFLHRLFVPAFAGGGATVGVLYYLRNYAVILLLGCWFCTETAGKLYARLREHRFWRNLLLVALFLLCVAYLVDSANNPLLYLRF